MTLLVALSGADGLVVASDSRGTFGDPRGVTAQNDAQKKLYTPCKYGALLAAGSGELGATLINEINTKVAQDGVEGVTALVGAVHELVRQRYRDWFPNFAMQPNPQGTPVRPDLNLMIAGYDVDSSNAPSEQRIFQLVSQIDFAPMLHNYGFALAGVASYALYLLNRLYERNSTIDQLRALAVYVITETASQDGKVGGPVQMATITKAEGCRELSEADVERVLAENTDRSQALKQSFFSRKVETTPDA